MVQHWGCEPQIIAPIKTGTPPWVGRTRLGLIRNWRERTFRMCGWESVCVPCLVLMSNGIGHTIPLACQDWANTKAAYRFFSNPRITEEEILSGHFASTRLRSAAIDE